MEEKEDKQKFIDRISTKLLSLESERKNRILKLIFKQIVVLVIFYLTFLLLVVLLLFLAVLFSSATFLMTIKILKNF